MGRGRHHVQRDSFIRQAIPWDQEMALQGWCGQQQDDHWANKNRIRRLCFFHCNSEYI
jgi:hypothetical protein